jgi:tRNA nucleotidyltransferase (CCA-adding enzyme)
LTNKLGFEGKKILQKVIKAANQMGVNTYLVGGTVRDLYLNKTNYDLDIAIEGNAQEFANFLNPVLGGDIRTYERFLSATITLPSFFVLDITTTRKEIYLNYGSLPIVEPGNIYDDLKRRDFSINSLAIKLNNQDKEMIIDPFNGLNDLDKGLIKVLHNESFREDPTRILRAARLLTRLKFNLEENTEKTLTKSIKYINRISGTRLKNEYKKIVKEDNTLQILHLVDAWGVTPYVFPGIKLNYLNPKSIGFIKTWCRNRKEIETWLILLMLIYWQCSPKIDYIFEVPFDFSKKEKLCLEWMVENRKVIKRLIQENINFSFIQLHRLMYNVPEEVETFLLSLLGEKREFLIKEIKKARQGVYLPITGRDLLKYGFRPGPIIGKILNNLEQEVLEGRINTREEALNWLLEMRDNYAE